MMTRCPAALFLASHYVLMSQKRDTAGELAVPHALVWDCLRCGRRLGETVLFPIVPRPPAASRLLALVRRVPQSPKGDRPDAA